MRNRNLARLCTVALLILAALTSLPSRSDAGWSYEGVRWRMLGRGAIGFGQGSSPPGGTDTTYVSGAPARSDTTTSWNMLDCEHLPLETQGANAADSVASAYVVVVGDSSVASSINFKNTTVTLQVNYAQSSTGWQTIYSALSPLATDGTKALIVPIFSRLAAITTDLGIDYTHPGDSFAPAMRAIVTWGTAAAVPSARVYIKKYSGVQQIGRQGSAAPSFGPN